MVADKHEVDQVHPAAQFPCFMVHGTEIFVVERRQQPTDEQFEQRALEDWATDGGR